MSLSVLMSVYHGTDASELSRCFDSIAAQSRKAEEIVLVLDGGVDDSVKLVIDTFSSLNINCIAFEQNRGLGLALNDGLKHCKYDIVARMDSDDTCSEYRFSQQFEFLEKNTEISVVGAMMREYYQYDNAKRDVTRTLPLNHSDIIRFARFRNPLNHPTVMFRKSDVENTGGYRDLLYFEDYYLWARMLKKGYKLANIDTVLVTTNTDTQFFSRRGGKKYFLQELKLAIKFNQIKFHTIIDSLCFIVMRVGFRLVPGGLRKFMYLKLLRKA